MNKNTNNRYNKKAKNKSINKELNLNINTDSSFILNRFLFLHKQSIIIFS